MNQVNSAIITIIIIITASTTIIHTIILYPPPPPPVPPLRQQTSSTYTLELFRCKVYLPQALIKIHHILKHAGLIPKRNWKEYQLKRKKTGRMLEENDDDEKKNTGKRNYKKGELHGMKKQQLGGAARGERDYLQHR